MRIVVNNIAASSRGALTILKSFYNYVSEYDNKNKWIFLLGDDYLTKTWNIDVITLPHVKKSGIRKIIFDFITGRKFINKLEPDVVFSMQNIITFGVKVPQIAYIHQSLPYQTMKKFSLFKSEERVSAIYQKIIGRIIDLSAKKADKVIVQSKWMKKAVVRKTGIPEEKIVNILPDIEDISGYKMENVFDKKRFFYPTTNNIYKNNECIYKACVLLRQKGITDFKVKLTLSEDSFNQKSENIDCIGLISKEAVYEEYNKSTLIFPSYVETVGLPLVEARQMGSIILASDCPFSREVLEGYENSYFFNQFKPQELAALMEKVMNEEITKTKVLSESKVNASNSWSKVVEEVVSI